MSNKAILILFAVLSMSIASFGQKTAEDYRGEGLEAMYQKQLKVALSRFYYIVEHHPRNPMCPQVYFLIGEMQKDRGKYQQAKAAFLHVLNDDFAAAKSIDINGVGQNPSYNYKHEAAASLFQIYLKKKKYDSSLYYLSLADTVYTSIHFYAEINGHKTSDRVYKALQYANLYRRLNRIGDAEKELLKVSFEVEENGTNLVIEELKKLFMKYEQSEAIKSELLSSIEHFASDSVKYPAGYVIDGADTVKYAAGSYQRHYILFRGVKVKIDDYIRLGNEVYVSKLDNQIFDDRNTVAAYLKQSKLYRLVQEL